MTAQEIAGVLAIIRMEWPHSNLGGNAETVTAYWHSVLGRFDRADVEGAVREIIASGRDHAPGPGVIANMCAARITDAPDWDEAWRETLRVIARVGSYRVPRPDEFSHPTIAAFAIPAWAELCSGPAAGTNNYGTHHAQQREAYRALAARDARGVALEALGAPRRRSELGPAGGALSAATARLLGKR